MGALLQLMSNDEELAEVFTPEDRVALGRALAEYRDTLVQFPDDTELVEEARAIERAIALYDYHCRKRWTKSRLRSV